MKVVEGKAGRTFILRMDDGDKLPDCIENFATTYNVKTGYFTIIGGVNHGQVVAGPKNDKKADVAPIIKDICEQPYEIVGLGTIVTDETGKPTVHLHGALGREDEAIVGCLRYGINTWLMCEIILQEIIGTNSKRVFDETIGLSFLNPE